MLCPTKRQRLECPPSWMDCESLVKVPSASVRGFVSTNVADSHTQDIFLERFTKEVIEQLQFSLAGTTAKPVPGDKSLEEKSRTRERQRVALSERVIVGVNACTKLLHEVLVRTESLGKKPLLIVCCDLPSILSHVPVYAQQLEIPVILLPQECCRKLGGLLGIRCASIIVFDRVKASTECEDEDGIHGRLDSFVEFVSSKLVADASRKPGV